MERKLRWGILGAANIARKNWDAIRNSGNGAIVAVASRNEAKAQSFIDECQSEVPFGEAPRAIGGYDEMIAADDLDAIYIPLPTGMRKRSPLQDRAIQVIYLVFPLGSCNENRDQI